MKRIVVLFVALTFLVTFSLIGCNQSQPPAKPAAEKGATGARGAPGAPGPWSAWSAWSACARQKK